MLTRIIRFLTGLESTRIESAFDKEWTRMQAEQPSREEKLEKDLAKAYEQLAKYHAADCERERAALEKQFRDGLAPFPTGCLMCEKCDTSMGRRILSNGKTVYRDSYSLHLAAEHLIHQCPCGHSTLTKTKDA